MKIICLNQENNVFSIKKIALSILKKSSIHVFNLTDAN